MKMRRNILPAISCRRSEAGFPTRRSGSSAPIRPREFKTWRALPGVHVTGTVADIRPWIWSAAVYASPLRFGLGVKNKILEAMACGAPIVATSRSLSGTPLIDGRDAMIADDDAKFAELSSGCCRTPNCANRCRARRGARPKPEYSWDSIYVGV